MPRTGFRFTWYDLDKNQHGRATFFLSRQRSERIFRRTWPLVRTYDLTPI